MPPKSKVRKEDKDDGTVIIFDRNLLQSDQARRLINLLKTQELDKKMRLATRDLSIKSSVEWIVPKFDLNGERVLNVWQTVKLKLVLLNYDFFFACAKDFIENNDSIERFLMKLFRGTMNTADNIIKVLIVLDSPEESQKMSGFQFEKKRVFEEKLHGLIANCLLLHGVEIDPAPKSMEEVAIEIFRASKTVFEAKTSDAYFGRNNDVWIPRKSGPPVSVSLTRGQHVGLLPLWQKYLMQISKVIGVEQAKSLSACDHFSSMSSTIETYRNCLTEKEGEEFASKNCLVRPPASARDVIGFRGMRPNIGIETSRKIFKFFTSLDGDEKI